MAIASSALSSYADLLAQSRKPLTRLSETDWLCSELGACLGCAGGPATLRRAITAALANGVPVARVESVLVHLAAYAGLGAAEQGMAVLEASLTADGATAGSPRLALMPATTRDERIRLGFAAYRQFDPNRPEQQALRYAPLSPDYYPASMELLGCTFADTGLALREREIASVACLAALGCCPDQLRFHVKVALQEGVTQDQLAGVLMLVQVHAGIPRAHNAAVIAVEVLAAASAT